jgi:hypothetical protein
MQMSYVIPKVPFTMRLVALAGFAALGMAAQILVPGGGGFILGLLLMVPGILLASAKNYRNKPMDIGQEDWQPASAAEFNRIRANLSMTKKSRYSVFYKGGIGIAALVVLGVAAFFLFSADRRFAAVLCVDGFVLLIPVLFTGNVSLWTPQELAGKMRVFEAIVSSEPLEGGDIILTPYLRLDKDKQGRQIPEDIRLMAEPRRKPADFLGVQLQVAINKGPNGAVPYMYAVFLCKGKGDSYQRFAAERYGEFVREPGGDKEYGYVVVRQRTERGGYHTTPDDCRELYALVKEKLRALLSLPR